MKILEITNYSAGGCGVFARVKQEAQLLAKKGNEVMIFSSNVEKGSDKIVGAEDKIGNVKIKRFPAKKLGGESFMSFHFEKEAEEFKPDVIIAHGYRHPHTTRALCVGEKIGAKVFLVTHAPFAREKNRGFIGNMAVGFYDFWIGRKMINKFDKIFAITNWEIPYLEKLGVERDKIEYVPNGISKEYLSKVASKRETKIIYTGRIAPIKNLEVVIKALPLINDIKFEIYGPAEEKYLDKLKELIKELKLEKRVEIIVKNYDRKMHIKELDKNSIFILPSFSEGMPQVLIEAMARKCIVVGSDNLGNRDLIVNGENGFLFENNNAGSLSQVVNGILNMSKEKKEEIVENARKTTEKFEWDKIVDKIEKIIRDT